MADSLKILFISAEVAPFAKKGGLGDVGSSLPKALMELGHDIRVIMPAYRTVEESLHNDRYDLSVVPGQLNVRVGSSRISASVFEGHLPGSKVPIYFIAEGQQFNRPEIYGYADDPYRFSFFSLAALELCKVLDWRPDVVHANDWHTAPAVTWLDTAGQSEEFYRDTASLFTIHNLAHQGKTEWQIFDFLGILTHSLTEEAYGEINFMARGIYHATLVNTVSPTYSREILTADGGAGMDGLLRYRSYDLHGILNGLDYQEWDPANDSRLAKRFDADHLELRKANKSALQEKAGLTPIEDIPVLAMITRLDWQKGLDITGHVVHLLLNGFAGDAQFIVLGTGDPQYEQMFAQLASYHSDKMAAFLSYDPDLAPLIYGGCDIFLMPSLFEPCGLGQMIAMRYGAIPVVRTTGGLVDTVEDGINGYTFHEFSSGAFWNAIERALWTYNVDPELWRKVQLNGLQADYSWKRSALGYQQLYEWAVARKRH